MVLVVMAVVSLGLSHAPVATAVVGVPALSVAMALEHWRNQRRQDWLDEVVGCHDNIRFERHRARVVILDHGGLGIEARVVWTVEAPPDRVAVSRIERPRYVTCATMLRAFTRSLFGIGPDPVHAVHHPRS